MRRVERRDPPAWLWLFLPYCAGLLTGYFLGFPSDFSFLSILPAALILLLVGASSVYGPLVSSAVFLLLGLCTAEEIGAGCWVRDSTLTVQKGIALSFCFIAVFAAGLLGLKSPRVCSAPAALRDSARRRAYIKRNLLQALLLLAAAAVFILIL